MQPAGVIQKTRLVPQLGWPCPSPGHIPTKDALWVLGCYGAIREVKDTERGGFEPPLGVTPNLISSQAHSTTLPPLQGHFLL
jgi:hypothetical protein